MPNTLAPPALGVAFNVLAFIYHLIQVTIASVLKGPGEPVARCALHIVN
jgi:hypothetical protein